MRHLGALLLVTGLSVPAFAEAPPAEKPSESIPWYRRVFLGEREKPAPKPAPEAETTERPTSPGPRATPMVPPQELAKRRYAEEHKLYVERLLAISQIRKIASDRGDQALLQKADDLEVQAEQVFMMRTALLPKLGGGGDDRATLERGRDVRPASAARPTQGRQNRRGTDR